MTRRRELAERVARLEAEVAELREQLAAKAPPKPRPASKPKTD
jgi:uncharacterized small protein (DUF1192 family)